MGRIARPTAHAPQRRLASHRSPSRRAIKAEAKRSRTRDAQQHGPNPAPSLPPFQAAATPPSYFFFRTPPIDAARQQHHHAGNQQRSTMPPSTRTRSHAPTTSAPAPPAPTPPARSSARPAALRPAATRRRGTSDDAQATPRAQADWHETVRPDPPTPSQHASIGTGPTRTNHSKPAKDAGPARSSPAITRLPLPRSPSRMLRHPSARPAPAPSRASTATRYQLPSRTTRTEHVEGGWSGSAAHHPTPRNPNEQGRGAGRGTPRCHDLRGGEKDTLSGLLQLTACDKQLHGNPGFGRRRPAATSREELPSSTQADRCQSLVGAPRAPTSLPARAAGRRSQAAPTTLDERADSQVC